MNSGTLAWSFVWIALTALAAIRLWRCSGSPVQFVKDGYRWLAVAALCLGLGGTAQQAFGGLIGGAAPLRLADLISLAALPALVLGLATITAPQADADRARTESSRWRFSRRVAVSSWPPTRGQLIDGTLLAVSLFAICVVAIFGRDYVSSGAGPAGFALDLIRPVADLAALALAGLLIPRNPRLTLLPACALAAVALADALAVGSRASGTHQGIVSDLALAVALCLLSVVPGPGQATARQPVASQRRPVLAWSAGIRLAGPVAALAAAIVIAGVVAFSRPPALRAVAITATLVIILLVIRLAWFTSQAVTVTASADAFDWAFRSLAESTSDTVLICDASGVSEYVSPAISELGYEPDAVTGVSLADLIHPEDRQAATRAAMISLHGAAGAASFQGRVRGADGSWRRVTARLARYGQPGEPARLLISCHDDSELNALRWQLTQVTYHDGVTGLPNRTYLEDRAKEFAVAASQPGAAAKTTAALIIGLDGGAAAPELGGHHGESLVVAQAGRRLRAAAPVDAIVARWGNDQFAVLSGDLGQDGSVSAGQAQACELAGRLAEAIAAEPFTVAGKDVSMTASVGLAVSPATEADQVLGRAYVAMLKASQGGGGRVDLFSPQMRAQAERRAELAGALSEAMADRQLKVEYRPVADLASGRVACVEALVGWVKDGIPISADELACAAGECGLLVRLADWLLRESCAQLAAWRDSGAMLGLAVRVSGGQLAAPGFAGLVLSALDDAGLPPQVLTLVVAEPALVQAPDTVAADLADLRAKGVRVAIGGFGTGYASLSYLRQLTVDIVELDGSLTAGLGADPTLTLLIPAILNLGRELGIEMIAGGVDCPDQADALMQLGCALGHGSWLGVALPGAAIEPVAAQRVAFWQRVGSGAEGTSSDEAADPACSPAS